MALGGGKFSAQNKVLPGTYINFVSASRATSALSDRGIATMPLMLDWGVEDTIFAVTAKDFQADSLRIFGYPFEHEKLKGLRDLFRSGIQTGYFYRLNKGEKASNLYATARYSGVRGNDLKIVVEANVESTEETPVYDVSTFLGSTQVDRQMGVTGAAQLKDNDFVTFNTSASLALTAGTALDGGTNGTPENSAYQTYLNQAESISFNVMGCLSTDKTVKDLFVSYTKRMRDDCGIKFQCVLFRPEGADYEGVIGVENGLQDNKSASDVVYWATGSQASCAVNGSLTNALYTGEFAIDTQFTQSELEDGIKAGKLMLHRVGDEIRVLEDVNTFVSAAADKSEDFSSNQTIRVLDQIGNDIAAIFNNKYLGKIQNDASARISLWNDIVKHHQELQALRAIENFSGDNVTVEAGNTKKSVVVTDYVTPVNAMEQLYMTIVVQ